LIEVNSTLVKFQLNAPTSLLNIFSIAPFSFVMGSGKQDIPSVERSLTDSLEIILRNLNY